MDWKTTAFSIAGIAILAGLFNWQSGTIDKLKKDNVRLSGELLARQAVFDTHLKLTAVINEVSQINVSQRERTSKDTEKVKTVIKTVFVGNDCADASIPSDYTDELRRFRNGEVHTSNDTTNFGPSDR